MDANGTSQLSSFNRSLGPHAAQSFIPLRGNGVMILGRFAQDAASWKAFEPRRIT
jgi:hypothetical protein